MLKAILLAKPESSQEYQLIIDMIWIVKCGLVGSSMEKFKEESGERILNLDSEIVWSSLIQTPKAWFS